MSEAPALPLVDAPYYDADGVTVYAGDCLDVLRTLPNASIDAVVTDPPYGLGFMGKAWDALPPGREWAAECLRVLKPGGHLVAFGGSRTWHRLAAAIEDGGFEIRDSLAWLYGSGFPKSLNLIDEHGERTGWGTALKPAFEPIVMGRKPLDGTVAANVLAHGTGALNIDSCRVGEGERPRMASDGTYKSSNSSMSGHNTGRTQIGVVTGRWPANVVLDEDQAAVLDQQSGVSRSRVGKPRGAAAGDGWGVTATGAEYDDSGGASRFFYVAKAPKAERPRVDGVAHPTVKPLALMRWLVRLITPPGGLVLEPFAGSGTTVEACIEEGFRCVAIERDPTYLPLITQRIERATPAPIERPQLVATTTTNHEEHQMSQSMSPEQFLSLPHDPEDDQDDAPVTFASARAGDNSAYAIPPGHETVVRHPLVEIATSLATIADSLQRPLAGPSDEERRLREQVEVFKNHALKFEAQLEERDALLDGVREICKPSVGKLAIAIRALLDPEPEPQVSEPPADAPAGEPAAEPQDQPPQTGMLKQPETNADVEDWRAYARELGYAGTEPVPGAAWIGIEQMNRSQIRTMLGVPHTPDDAEGHVGDQPAGGAA